MTQDDGWVCWAVRAPGKETVVEWAVFNHRDGLLPGGTSPARDLEKRWSGQQWNLKAVFWRPHCQLH